MFKVYLIETVQNGEKSQRLTFDYEAETYPLDAEIKVIGHYGVTVASKAAGEASLTVGG